MIYSRECKHNFAICRNYVEIALTIPWIQKLTEVATSIAVTANTIDNRKQSTIRESECRTFIILFFIAGRWVYILLKLNELTRLNLHE